MPRPPCEDFTLGTFETPIGTMRIAVDGECTVRALDWSDHDDRMRALLRRAYGEAGVRLAQGPLPTPVRGALAAYFDGELDALDALAVRARGTPFQRAVWAALRDIPAGATESYGALAARIGRPRSVRAVGAANGANPIGLIVPCHRVIGADGTLTGYGGGLDRKRWLLAHEGAMLAEVPA